MQAALFCMRSQALFGHLKLGGLLQTVVKAIRGKQVFWAIGFMTSASLFLEEKVRLYSILTPPLHSSLRHIILHRN
jgi:hypothetical protein